MIEIKNRYTGEVIRIVDAETLISADLRGANLRGANLIGANLINANLRGANLINANLIGANLINANLIGANLINANLIGANLRGANLRGAKYAETPVVSDIKSKILKAIEAEPQNLEMGSWHSACGTTHCLAGWAIHLAGKEGYELERKLGSPAAGALIFAASCGEVPDFYSENDEAIDWLKGN